MSTLPTEDRGGAGADRPPPSLRRKILLTAFILFHFGCVAVWVFPKMHPVRTFLLTRAIPLPTRLSNPATKATGWHFEPLPLIGAYLGKTGQWQHWTLFAPDPMPYHRHLGGRVTFRSGKWKEYTLPRVEQLDAFHAHLHARYREYQYGLSGPREVMEDLARYIARSWNDPSDPPQRVTVFICQMEIPKHDRPGRPAAEDYPTLLRDPARIVNVPIVDYEVKPEDLR